MQKGCLHTENLTVGYNNKELLGGLNLTLQQGELVCLLGPNGVGKSTLIKTLIGETRVISGSVFFNDKELKVMTPKDLAYLVSIVLTHKPNLANLSVFDLVAMGRTPYTNWLGKLKNEDIDIINQSMQLVKVEQFSIRTLESLSDGEKQRVMVAKALAQDTPLIILDEPTAHLDVNNRFELLTLLKQLAKQTQKAILLSTHELELALKLADKVWLIDNEQQMYIGKPQEQTIREAIEQTFKGYPIQFEIFQ